ncbi:MAG: TetR/AcrR family transcriptional regulator [Bacteroidetes bacterium]|nr:TetR/AcrR family transcriptional regulator [Bacteroidota bacterium]
MDVRERILEESEMLFFRYGVRRVTMDDVAKALGMSKKTLYQYYSDKDELVAEATQAHLDRERIEFDKIFRNSENSIKSLFSISQCMRKSLSEINPSVLFELKRFYPKSWEYWTEFKDQFIFKSIVENIKKGIEEEYFRSEVNAEILANLRVMEIQILFDRESFPSEKFNFMEVQMQLFNHFVYGIATEKGRKLYKEYLENENNESYE